METSPQIGLDTNPPLINIRTYPFASGHTLWNTPDPIRTRKISHRRPGQYWGGGPPGKPLGAAGFFWPFFGDRWPSIQGLRIADRYIRKLGKMARAAPRTIAVAPRILVSQIGGLF